MSHYTEEFKLSAVKLVLRGNKKAVTVARELDIRPSTLHTWVAKYKSLVNHDTPKKETHEQANQLEELKKLRKENKRLKEERDILVKAAAFFAKESVIDTRS